MNWRVGEIAPSCTSDFYLTTLNYLLETWHFLPSLVLAQIFFRQYPAKHRYYVVTEQCAISVSPFAPSNRLRTTSSVRPNSLGSKPFSLMVSNRSLIITSSIFLRYPSLR